MGGRWRGVEGMGGLSVETHLTQLCVREVAPRAPGHTTSQRMCVSSYVQTHFALLMPAGSPSASVLACPCSQGQKSAIYKSRPILLLCPCKRKEYKCSFNILLNAKTDFDSCAPKLGFHLSCHICVLIKVAQAP